MTDERFEELMRDAQKTYRTPPATDFDAMWDSIEAAHFGGETIASSRVEQPRARRRSSIQWMGIAATLVVGIGIGRVSVRVAPTAPVAVPVASTPEDQGRGERPRFRP